jgi:hypothetical protein
MTELTMRLIKNEDLEPLKSIRLDREYTGDALSFDEDGFVVVATHRTTDACFIAVSWKGKSKVFLISEPYPILVEFLAAFKDYPHEVRTRIQRQIISYHMPTYRLLADHRDSWEYKLNCRNQQSFTCCSNIELSARADGQLFFVAITGPSREWSEGMVLGVVDSGKAEVELLKYGIESVFSQSFPDATVHAFKQFVDAADIGD